MQIYNESGVELIDSMGDDLAVVDAARVSFNNESEWANASEEVKWLYGEDGKAFEIKNASFEGILSEKDQKLIKYLARHNHWTPFAHTAIKLRIRTSFAIARQLGKHQVGFVWNEVSRRYVDAPPTYFFPASWRMRADNAKQGSSEEEIVELKPEVAERYDLTPNINENVMNLLEHSHDLYQAMIESGVCPEQARFVIPMMSNTEWIWTGSLVGFARVFSLRMDPHAQKEVQEVAYKIGLVIPSKFKHSWAALTAGE